MTKVHKEKITKNLNGKMLYDEALRYCTLNRPDEAIEYMQKAVQAGFPLALLALEEITKIVKREESD